MKPSVFVFERLAALLQQLVREDAARHGLLPVHLQVLGYLAQANRYSNIPIAVPSTKLAHGTLTDAITRLVSAKGELGGMRNSATIPVVFQKLLRV